MCHLAVPLPYTGTQEACVLDHEAVRSSRGRCVQLSGGRELRTIGAVATAIGRCSETVRRAHADRRLPPPTATLQLEDGRKVRLYDRAYVELAPALFAVSRRH